jgi:fructoselysine-6-phosphate deglycase
VLNFDEPRFTTIQAGALALAQPLRETIGQLLRDGATNLVFAGIGGAGILMLPAVSLLQSRSTFPAAVQVPAEVMLVDSAAVGVGTIVVIPSLSGTTAEAQEALAWYTEKGATVTTLTGYADSPLAVGADHTFTAFAEDDTSSESFYLQSLIVALAIMEQRGEIDDVDRVFEELSTLPQLLLEVKRSFEPRAAELAVALADDDWHVITGAGSSWAQAFYYGMCILEEMQWVRTRPIHASDFFHGTLELVEKGVSVIVLQGEDSARPLTERVARFAPRVTEKLTVIDTTDFELPGISADVRALISPVLLATVLERLSAHLEVVRRHPLVVRRYYKRISY